MSVELSNAEAYISWLNTKTRLNANASKAANRFVKRGQVYWCHFGINVGSEISKTTPRPAVVVSNYNMNRNSSNIIVVPITHNSNKLPCMVPITPINDSVGNVILDGQVNTAEIVRISKARLGDLITTLSLAEMREIDEAISISVGLLHYYKSEKEKYEKLSKYVERVKLDRNQAQDTLKQMKDMISQNGFNEETQEKIRRILDIEPIV